MSIFEADRLDRPAMTLPAGGLCGKKSCWSERPKGFVYKDAARAREGIAQRTLAEGVDGKSQIQLKAKGSAVPLPALDALVSPVTVQLRLKGGARCWGATYSFPPVTKHDASIFKDKAD